MRSKFISSLFIVLLFTGITLGQIWLICHWANAVSPADMDGYIILAYIFYLSTSSLFWLHLEFRFIKWVLKDGDNKNDQR
jgi:hypothetical protein